MYILYLKQYFIICFKFGDFLRFLKSLITKAALIDYTY